LRLKVRLHHTLGRHNNGGIAMTRTLFATVLALSAFAFSVPAGAQDDTQRLGTVHFETSCNEQAQRRFDRGMRYQHSFWYQSSKEIFEDVLKADPGCAIAYWGIALSLLFNPHAPPPAPNMLLGLAAIEKGKALGPKTSRERDYIDALAVMYVDHDKVPRGQRVQAYLKAMEAVAARYSQDDEAQILYAIALNVAASPNDKTYANQLKGAAILEPLFERKPNHPGVAHYLIHLYDTPALAEKGLDAARRYAAIAPAAPHAQHMPSHIFTRIGAWKESIASNAASANAAKTSKEFDDQLHAQDYMVYAYLQIGEDEKARALVAEMHATAGVNPNRFSTPYALAVGPARHAIERADWTVAAALEVRPSRFPYADAMTHFARALGAARLGKVETAKGETAKLAELRDKLRAAKDAYWTEQVDIQFQIASAWTLFAEGRHDDALAAMSAAADAEDRTDKHPVTPGVPTPARELYGTMLLERGKAKEALVAFTVTLQKEPNRFGATLGVAMAAERLGDAIAARQHYGEVVALTEGAATTRPAIAHARDFVAKK
jgi:Tfp pilus assembly protein PilF